MAEQSAAKGVMPPPRQDNGMPGGRAALPAGTLSKTYLAPQGDEHRDPPADAPSPVNPVATVPHGVEGVVPPPMRAEETP
jgi:hypothetical protein